MRATWCLCFALAACTVGPDFRTPDAPADATFTRGAAPTQGFVQVDEIGGAWWKAFGSADLDRLVRQALEASPTLAQARARLAQAREDYAAQAGTRYPGVDLGADVSRQQINPPRSPAARSSAIARSRPSRSTR